MDNRLTELDFNDGLGPSDREPWEIIVFIMLQNYGPDNLTKDLKDVDAFDDWHAVAGQRMPDIIADFETKRTKAAAKGHKLSIHAFSRKFLRGLGIGPTSELWDDLLKHCDQSLPTTEPEWKELLNKLKKRDDRKRLGQVTKTHLADSFETPSQSAFPTWTDNNNWPATMGSTGVESNLHPATYHALSIQIRTIIHSRITTQLIRVSTMQAHKST